MTLCKATQAIMDAKLNRLICEIAKQGALWQEVRVLSLPILAVSSINFNTAFVNCSQNQATGL